MDHYQIRLQYHLIYIMNLKMGFGLPSPHYYQTVYEGYNDCGLNTDVLNKALADSATQFYALHRPQETQQTLFDTEDEDDFISDEDEQDMDEDNPFYFSGGMQL